MGLITAGVAVAAAAGAAYAKKKAGDKAAKAREDALNGLKKLDIPAINDEAAKADEASYTGKLDLQKRADPLSAAAREGGLKALTENINAPGDAKASGLVDKIAAGQDDPALESLRQRLLTDASTALDAGATIPADVQAELVRQGLESGARVGVSPDKAGAQGQTLRRLTGAAGLALEEQRRQRAISSTQAAQSIAATKASILSSLIPQIQSITAGKTARAGAAFGAGASQTPGAYGLTGADVAGMEIANTNLENNKRLGIGEVQAGRALNQGQMTSSIIGAVGSQGSTLLGNYAKSNPDSFVGRWG